MVKITKNEKETIFEVKGLHKILAFKSEMRIHNSHFVKAYCYDNDLNEWKVKNAFGKYISNILKT